NLNELKSQDKMIESLKEEQKELREDYYIVAKKLSNLRQEKAKEFENLIAKELQELAMEKAEFKIEFEEKEPGLNGIDKIEFMITTNPGEELKPLAKIASGGELSRIMLALKTIIAHIDQVDTMIFDEVDSGVGGKTAQKMAEKLALIAKRRQVMCITHLPQIASMGDNHYFINKQNDEDKTFTKIVLLDEKGKKNELARMLGGVETTETTMKHAQEMIDMAKDKKVNL
ncbi:MAG: DNA repair protein RecN, partial [Halanaerobiales bacterium]